ncbi:SAM-dependent methyltransferase [Thalassobaculum fulvum]|jgi:phospholipid N-methyltransferase|uniref:SAM-dependent methyltransferase n=1 Tax=Thalassobaculum fulvum TaxID=1633335 RepID=A0A919CNS8_9PROT|nr:rRNA adenine N-6-methyltransferase family protein [Thalassobaculum fulvum]GHD43738.1 SAM-dependent methyltransferase [Thalassobaculum fulvum]
MSDAVQFLRAWIADPIRLGSITPSSSALAALITSEITPQTTPVVELGPGTGVFTKALLARGVPPDRLLLVEREAKFAAMLRERFPGVGVLAMDATDLGRAELFGGEPVKAVVSGLPFLSMPTRAIMGVLDGCFAHMSRDGSFYQFTYGARCPVPRAVLERLGLKSARVGRTFSNFPPATVYRFRRRPMRRLYAVQGDGQPRP